MRPASHQVIVVGAGFAGLAAAGELVARGVDCIVLEARDRVGGRVEATNNVLGEALDTGGQFFCEDMPEITALVRRFGKTAVAAPTAGRFTMQPPMDEARTFEAYAGAMAIRERMNRLHPDDLEIAGLSAAAWLDRQPDAPGAKAGFRSMIEGLWCQPLDEVPLWHLADNDRRITNETSELQYFVGETMHALAAEMAAGLGDRLLLGTPVASLSWSEGKVTAVTGGGFFAAERAIVAVPPVMASRIGYDPLLPARLRRALGVWRSGTVIKIQLRYANAFWRDGGLNGTVMWRDVHGLFACDTSRDAEHPSLVVFVGGPLALSWRAMGEEGMKAELRRRLTAALGEAAAGFIGATFRDWSDDPWSGGGYSDLIMEMDARDAEAVLREGCGPIGFVSSELSPSFPGYVEGALVAGRLAAQAAIEALAGQSDRATSASGS